MGRQNLLIELLSLTEGELVGRVRLQKVFYLLDQLGLNSGFEYEYHHYGPYSDELSGELITAILTNEIQETVRYRQSDGARYSTFKVMRKADLQQTKLLGHLKIDRVKQLVARFKDENATVLELAATIHWLKKAEKIVDWKTEIKARKGVKAEGQRLAKAENLLKEIGLAA